MTAGVTLIANQALSQVPAGAVTSLDEASVPARACKLWYAQCVSELLAKSTWRFARVRTVLAEIESDRLGEWAYAYTLPANMAFPITVLDEGQVGARDYLFSGTVIYTNHPAAVIEYVTTTDMSNQYDGLFKAALIALLASRVCLPITKDKKWALELTKTAEVAVERAVAFNANLDPARYMNHVPDVVAARFGMIPDGRIYPGPEAVYPDFDPVGAFEDELD